MAASLDADTTSQLIGSHGRLDVYLFWANLRKDTDRVVSFHMQRGQHLKALDEISAHPNNVEMFYKYSPVLIRQQPVATVTAWLKNSALEPIKLVPALMGYDQDNSPVSHVSPQDIRYLQALSAYLYRPTFSVCTYGPR